MSNIAKRIAELSSEKRELLARLLKKEGVDVSRAVITPRSPELAHIPLSYAQQRLWFLHQMEPDSPVYNIPDSHFLSGTLNIPALEWSLSEVVRRHEALRTTFQTVEGEPVQVIAPPAPVRLEVTDLSHLDEEEQETEARRYARAEMQQPFDLARGTLLRLRLLKMHADEHILLITMHHIISDGWSMGILTREISTLYEAFCEGRSPSLPEMTIQYADFAVWQREWLSGEVLEAQLDYWRKQLSGELAVLELPIDRARPVVPTYRGGVEVFEVGREVSERLREVSRESGATVFMTLLAAFNVLLYRYTGQRDICVGTPIANRNRAETEGLIGFFVNMLVLRTTLSGEMSFRKLLEDVRETTLGAFAHQDLPFEKLVEELQPERAASRMPFLQVVFNMLNVGDWQTNDDEPRPQFMKTEADTSKFDLRLAVSEREHKIYLNLRYSADLFDAARVRRMLEHFGQLLEGIAADPSQSLYALPLLSDGEREQALNLWQESRANWTTHACLHELFAAQVEKTPEAVAIVYENRRLTYRELDRRANRLAHHLGSVGVGAEVLAGICLERSPDMIVGLLGILKAGGAYLPLEPESPAERLAFVLADAQPRVVVTERKHSGKFDGHGITVVCLDADRDAFDGESDEPPQSGATPDNLAYVIYTSGSTGRPKGTLVTHRNVARLFAATHEWFGFDERDVWTLFHSYAFDFSVWEMWGALLYGGRLIVVPYFVSRSPEAFYEVLAREKVTVLNQTPSAFRQLMRVDESRRDAEELSLRLVIFGGEALEVQSLRAWFDSHGDARPQLVNMYGITETTVHVTYRPLAMSDAVEASGSRIGMPIADLEVYVLDRYMTPVPFGITGEMYVGGAGLARAYLNRAGLTAERFPPDPFSTQPGARLYKTGDLVRLLAGGDMEYVGRLDEQVKIRGFRIELGEIEAALAAHRGVRESVVVAREDQPGDRRLTAYLVNTPHEPLPDVDELRGFLLAKLPEHMIPAAFVWMDNLPLTVNGKIDRRALPAPGQARPALKRNYVAPRNRLEALLAGMWSEVLGTQQVGVEDDFFGLGGDSIKGAIFINRLQEKLGEIVHVITIFQSPTIARLAAYLTEQYADALHRMNVATDSRQPPTQDSLSLPATATHAPSPGSPTAAPAVVDDAKIARLRQLVEPLPPRATPDGRAHPSVGKNPPAVFVLSPPRSGSTLFRVMLAGHPQLFAPPELELLSFNTLAERRAAFSGSRSFWLEGTIRAVMEIKGCEADEAKAIMQEWERRGLTTRECYRLLQDWIGEKRLVDKTPSYALDRSILERAETDFHDARYIHLLRHPYGMVRSFEEARLEQIFFRYEHGFSRRELAELIWLVSNENILEFLGSIPAERHHRVRFEELLEHPEATLRGVCRFLGLEFAADMLQPYRDKGQRMTDGIHAQSRMLGDVKFHRYTGIEARVGHRWREHSRDDSLAGETWRVAGLLGYEREPDAGEKRAATPPGLKPIPRHTNYAGAEFPLSFAQQRLWFIHQLSPDSAAYHIPLALRLSGRLNVRALEQSLDRIVERHAALRTTFPIVDGQPVQVVAPFRPSSLPVIDLSGLNRELREDRARQLSNEEAEQPFDLARGTLLRLRLLKMHADEHILLITMHHIISDGWSMGILTREISTLYEAFCEGRSPSLPEMTIQYADFAVWQREWLSGEVLEAQLDYWRKQLSGELAVLELPIDRARPVVPTYRGGVEVFEVGREVSERLREVSRESGATVFMTLLAAFNVLLYRYTGQRDICVGTPIANRNRAELEHIIGFFVNTLVLRTRLKGEAGFDELLAQVRDMTRDAYRHQDVPFEKLVDELQPPREPSHTPLFQVLFTLQNASQEEIRLKGLEISWMETESDVAKFDLTLAVAGGEEGLSGAFVYDADIFEAEMIERLARHFENLLQSITENTRRAIAALPLLSAEERRMLLVDWNDTASPYPEHPGIHRLFETQVERTPDALAVVFDAERVTYGELNRRANRLAHYLRSRGVAPEIPVGVLLSRSVEMVVALMAVLKAGGAYVPLDPAYPQERIAFMLDDSRVAVTISQRSLTARLPAHRTGTVCLETERELIARQSDRNPQPLIDPQNLAYIIYTSGSTGIPKGVAIAHHNAAVFLAWATAVFSPDVLARTLASTSICFDISTFEIFAPLSCGGAVVLVENALHVSSMPAAQEVTLINTVPSAMAELVRMQAIPPSVRVVNLAGEAFQNQLAQSIYEQGRRVERVYNLYGPSEDTTFSTFALVEKGRQRQPAIGRQISNTQLYVLDERLEPTPVGVAGQLYIGGEGVSRGYIRRPALTAERYIPNPLSGEAGTRMYRTGDIVRYREDGELEFLGRGDQQVKVRGYRIELGEIEARLREHQTVREAVVLVREDRPGDRRLVAYVVAEDGLTADDGAWRIYLKEKLPEYMIPSAFVLLDAMPLTPNGKIDRRALLAIKRDGQEDGKAFAPPRDELELQLARIWEELLDVRPVGIDENFFDLGGHSLLAVRMVWQVRKQLGRELPLASLLQAQTIEELAGVLRREVFVRASSPLVPIQPHGGQTPFFCVHPAGGNIVCYRDLSRRLGSGQPFYGLRSPLFGGATAAADVRLEEMAAGYVAALRDVQESGPYMIGGWSMGGVVAFEMAQQLHGQGEDVALLALLDSHNPNAVAREKNIDDEIMLEQFMWYMGRMFGMEEWLTERDGSAGRGVEECLRALVEEGVRRSVMPRDLGVEHIRQFFHVYRANVRAMFGYQPACYPGRITLLRASEHLNASATDEFNGWRDMAAGGVEVHAVPGDHFTMMKEPHVRVMAEWLKTCLAQSPVIG